MDREKKRRMYYCIQLYNYTSVQIYRKTMIQVFKYVCMVVCMFCCMSNARPPRNARKVLKQVHKKCSRIGQFLAVQPAENIYFRMVFNISVYTRGENYHIFPINTSVICSEIILKSG